jgi:D-arginine dehydrogenase
MSNDLFDVAIVGAGIAGVTLAGRLAKNQRVLLIERESQPGMHSTGRSAAMFMATYGSPQGRALTRASRAHYAAPAIVPVLAPRGALSVAWRGQEAQFEAMRAPGLEALGARATMDRVPVLREDGLLGAWYEPDAMDIDVHALMQSGLVHARGAGAQLWTAAELDSALRDGGEWTLKMTDGRQARASVLVNAAGAWADAVAERSGIAGIALQPCRRSAFTFDAPAGVVTRDWPATCAVDESWYFKPDAGQLLGSPANADPVPAHDVLPEALDIAGGIARIEEHTTLTIRRPRSTWAGLRSFVPDGEMVIGFDGGDGFFWLAGQGGWGIQSAAGAAMLAEALIGAAPLPDALRCEGVDPAALSPRRLR